jgi:hypothetical protein
MALPVVIAALPLSKVNPPTTATFWDVSIVTAVVVPFVFKYKFSRCVPRRNQGCG